ncbi:ornithine cyclodeaminase family protein [Methanoculleus sp. FWC-SCC1]|uniref:Alanine dehydrogenase n=1 Tax=Methanoculleus frigidifontis TaxID=2584085 RepID=A0ABT8M6C9_9EURY|nr:ornithine cyclodeaminase family protein [Methanoculleus sp. FWC-SCC1]MDN7023483.1 ornithine cyclodeaminase family protein [Methanoculleus sp. FWC-SCC1]
MRYYAGPWRRISIPDVNRAIEMAFAEHGRGNVQMPPKIYVTFDTGDFRTMPAYLPALGIAGVKVVNVHPLNRSGGLPTVMALTVLLDPATGLPQAIINATELTAMRTGAAGAVAAKYLSPKRRVTLGLVGTGRQAEAQVEAIAAELAIEELKVWTRKEKHAEAFAARYPDYSARSVPIRQACDCDVLVTTTPSTVPVVDAAWIADGTHINAIGADAPGKQELDPALLRRAEVYVDDSEQAVHSGEINVPLREGHYTPGEIAGTLGEVVIGMKRRSSSGAVTIFDSTGIAVQDLAIAAVAMRHADGIDLPFP